MLQFIRGRAGWLALGVAGALLASTAASAQPQLSYEAASMAGPRTVSGSANGLSWTAQSTIVGQTSTATIGGGGDPIYLPDPARHNGVVSLIMNYSNGDAFICSGSLMNNRRSIVTAGHCVSSGGGVEDADLVSTTAYFYDFNTGDPDDIPALSPPGAVAIGVSDYIVHGDYTGEVIDQNDIAVLTLSEAAPLFAQSYGLFTEGDLTGEEFNVAGYGARSDVGGALGDNLGPGRLRQGDNRYDFAWGDDYWGDFFLNTDPTDPSCDADDNWFCGDADIEYSFLADFDNGLAANDASCNLAGFFGVPGAQFCNTGRGDLEVGIAGGDSGGPGFIDGKLASVNSYGVAFNGVGDFNPGLNSSWGEFSGYVPIYIHEDFINAAMVPEPATWALLIGGFGLTGATLRRRRTVAVRA